MQDLRPSVRPRGQTPRPLRPRLNRAFRAGTPRRVFQDLHRRYSQYLVEREDKAVDYFETDLHKKVSAGTMTPGLWLKHLRDSP